MKKKNLAMTLLLMICMIGTCFTGINVQAEDDGEDVDLSYLMTEEALVGVASIQPQGIYLMDGNSFINKMGPTMIGAGGLTSAEYRCRVSVTSIVERRVGNNGTWLRVTSWTQTNENDFDAMISRSLTVATGHQYRVRSLHYAATDGSSSCTNALPM